MALRTTLDRVFGDDHPEGELRNDRVDDNLWRREKHDTDGSLTNESGVSSSDKNGKSDIFVRDTKSKSNNSRSSDERGNIPLVEEKFTSLHVEDTQSRKNLSGNQNSDIVNVIVPVKVSHLSASFTTKAENIPRQRDEPVRAKKNALPERSKTDNAKETESARDSQFATADTQEDDEKAVDVTKVYGYREMPYLSDEDTIKYIKQSHTMFIMRGLPGSGKSMLVKCLQQVYKGVAVVCSADHFFYDSDGTYNFDAQRLSEAHSFCQDKAANHCDQGTPVIIIDNTNIQRWEMSFYMKLAQKRCNYHVVIVEPLTPWRHDPDELAQRNKHNVDRELIEKKLKSLRGNVYRPLYYGWFVCKEDSSLLVKKSRTVLKQCVDEILWSGLNAENMSDSFSTLEEILNNVVICYSDPVPMLHCTAAYLARRSKDAYHMEEHVVQSLGKTFCLRISGFVYSKQAISARVALLENTNHVGKNAAKSSEIGSDFLPRGAEGIDKSVVDDSDILAKLYMKTEEEKLRERYSDVNLHSADSEMKHSLLNHGCSAHITICYANDGQSKLSGENLLNILEQEFYGKVEQQRSKVGVVSAYGNDMFLIQLNEPIEVRTMFQGFYPSRG